MKKNLFIKVILSLVLCLFIGINVRGKANASPFPDPDKTPRMVTLTIYNDNGYTKCRILSDAKPLYNAKVVPIILLFLFPFGCASFGCLTVFGAGLRAIGFANTHCGHRYWLALNTRCH